MWRLSVRFLLVAVMLPVFGQTGLAIQPAPSEVLAIEELELPDIDARYLSMSPDGQAMAGQKSGGENCVWRIADSSEYCATVLNSLGQSFWAIPAWSPDGTAIAFTAAEEGETPAIHIMDAISGEVANLTGDLHIPGVTSFQHVNPVWSLDGTEVAFIIVPETYPDNPYVVVASVDVEVGEVSILEKALSNLTYDPMIRLADDSLLILVDDGFDNQPDVRGGLWRIGKDREAEWLFETGEGTGHEHPTLYDARLVDGEVIALMADDFGGSDGSSYLFASRSQDDVEAASAIYDAGNVPVTLIALSPDATHVIAYSWRGNLLEIGVIDLATGIWTDLTSHRGASRPSAVDKETFWLEGNLIFHVWEEGNPQLFRVVSSDTSYPGKSNVVGCNRSRQVPIAAC